MAADSRKLMDQATAHFARMRAGKLTPAEERDIEAWIDSDPAHEDAYGQVSQLWSALGAVRSDPAILDLREDARRRLGHERAGKFAAAAAVALFVGGLGLWSGLTGFWRWPVHEPAPATYSTRVGQISTVALSDGSTAILDTDSAIQFSQREGRRSVELVRGRALFKVHHDIEHPFIVSARGQTVTALGTEFYVYARPAALEVGLLQGRVRVQDMEAQSDGRTYSEDMTAGHRLVAAANGWALSPLATDGPSWLERRLVFDEAPVADIAAELNRYFAKKIVIADPAVGRAHMSAMLRSDDLDTFVSSVQALHLAKVRKSEAGYILTNP